MHVPQTQLALLLCQGVVGHHCLNGDHQQLTQNLLDHRLLINEDLFLILLQEEEVILLGTKLQLAN